MGPEELQSRKTEKDQAAEALSGYLKDGGFTPQRYQEWILNQYGDAPLSPTHDFTQQEGFRTFQPDISGITGGRRGLRLGKDPQRSIAASLEPLKIAEHYSDKIGSPPQEGEVDSRKEKWIYPHVTRYPAYRSERQIPFHIHGATTYIFSPEQAAQVREVMRSLEEQIAQEDAERQQTHATQQPETRRGFSLSDSVRELLRRAKGENPK